MDNEILRIFLESLGGQQMTATKRERLYRAFKRDAREVDIRYALESLQESLQSVQEVS